MVKIQILERNDQDIQRESNLDIHKTVRSYDPQIHHFQKAKEHKRALNAVKLEKIFAKPFLFSIQHQDSVHQLVNSPTNINLFASGTSDGYVKLIDVSLKKSLFNIQIHDSHIHGLQFSQNSQFIFSSTQNDIFMSSFNKLLQGDKDYVVQKYISTCQNRDLDVDYFQEEFLVSGNNLQIFNINHTQPIHNYKQNDSVITAKYNPSEMNIIIASTMDRGILVFDKRVEKEVQKVQLYNKSSCLCWNYQEPINFIAGNDDSNIYQFDMRQLDKSRLIHKDFINSVNDVQFDRTGQIFVAGSSDQTIRIFDKNGVKSKEVYHTKRMQQVYQTKFTLDSRLILSASQDMNVRVWKTKADEKLGFVTKREQNQINYRQKLKERFQNSQEIRRIHKHRHLPKYIKNAKDKKQIIKESQFRKQNNIQNNNPSQFVPKNERKDRITHIQHTNQDNK